MNYLLHKTASDCNRKLAISSDFSQVLKIRINAEAVKHSGNQGQFQQKRHTVTS